MGACVICQSMLTFAMIVFRETDLEKINHYKVEDQLYREMAKWVLGVPLPLF